MSYEIIQGDCLEVMREMPDNSVHAILTDPPYKYEHVDGGGFASAREFYAGGSLKGMDDFDLSIYSQELIRLSQMLIAFCSRDLIGEYASLAKRHNRKFDLHVWHKTNAIPFTANTWKSDLEYICLIWKKKPGWVQLEQHRHSKLFQSSLCTDKFHPTNKPVALMEKYIEVLDAQTILDPFMGSGSTGVAAMKLGRRFIGIEISEEYCEIARKRIEAEDMKLKLNL